MEPVSARHEGDLGGRLNPLGSNPQRVHIIVDEGEAGSLATQHAAWMTANLLARMAEDVVSLTITAPEGIPLHERVIPWGTAATLADALVQGAQAIGITPVAGEPSGAETLTLVIGANSSAAGDLFVSGYGWTGSVSTDPIRTAVGAMSLPIGPYIAACLAARVVFARARTTWDDFNHSYSAWSHSSNPEGFTDGPCDADIVLGEVLLAGVGAVGTALMHTLWAARGVSGSVTVADGDEKGIEASNLNRCMLFRSDMIGLPKASAAAGLVNGESPVKWDPQDGRATDIVKFPALVVSAVDSNTSRAEIQSRYPSVLLSGSTRDLRSEILRCGPPGVGACLSCFNRPEQQPSDEQLKDHIRDNADMEAMALDVGATAADLRSWVETGRCGHLSQESLSRLRGLVVEGADSDWAVGFVSVFTGTILAAEVLKEALAAAEPLNSITQRSTFQFASLSTRPELHVRRYLRQQDCPRCSPGVALDKWRGRYIHRGPTG